MGTRSFSAVGPSGEGGGLKARRPIGNFGRMDSFEVRLLLDSQVLFISLYSAHTLHSPRSLCMIRSSVEVLMLPRVRVDGQVLLLVLSRLVEAVLVQERVTISRNGIRLGLCRSF